MINTNEKTTERSQKIDRDYPTMLGALLLGILLGWLLQYHPLLKAPAPEPPPARAVTPPPSAEPGRT